MTTALPPCPSCGSGASIRIAYGLPIPELVEAEERGEVILAGCVVPEDAPAYQCRACGTPLPWPIFGRSEDGGAPPPPP